MRNIENFQDMIDTNIDEVFDSELNDIGQNVQNKIDNITDIDITNKKNIELSFIDKIKPKYIVISWQTYRILSFVCIFISIFILQLFYNLLEKKGSSKYALQIYNIVAFFLLLNLGSFLFIFTYYKYRESIKGPKGLTGKRGIRGLPGNNFNCDTSKKKFASFTREKRTKDVKDPVEDMEEPETIINFTSPKKKWHNNKIPEQISGIGCGYKNVNGEADKTNCKYKLINNITNNKVKPLIGVAVNYNKNSGNIYTLQHMIDKNRKHDKFNYKVGLHGENKSKYSIITNDDEISGKIGNKISNKNTNKDNFVCNPNSAVYKIDTMYNNDGLKGLKYYCQDIKTGRSTKSINNGKETYGVVFGKEPVKDSKDYFFDSLYCETKKDTNNDKYYPTFITDIGAEYDNKNIKNLKINSCSYYK